MKGILASGSTETKREIVPSGTHIARCYSMIHIGTVEWEYQGETKYSNKIRVTFELPFEIRDFGGEEKPMVISKEYTLSLHEKSNLRRDLEGWRGKSFNSQELSKFDITNLISKECNISIIHKTSKSGNEFAQIGSISGMSKGSNCPDQINKSFIFNYEDNFNEEWLEEQPEWIKDQIKGTEQYKNKMNQQKFKEIVPNDMPF
mgnify:CR=1 FL=1|jgi:hypothetical protein|tara:strand:+ start:783 stop:1391 length:609 start_codon:yes stop_codon:yes gene_type:complete